jgi:outer membrane protein OmpA-like peptidoglycan-associated protein
LRLAAPGIQITPGALSGSSGFAYENGRLALEGTKLEAVQAKGRLSAQGQVTLQPLGADLNIEARDIDLAQAQPWVPHGLAIKSGAFSGNGRLKVRPGSRVTYEGAASVRDLSIAAASSGALLVASDLLETSEVHLALAPCHLEIGELVAHGPHARLEIAKDGSLNFATALLPGPDKAGGAQKPQWLLRRLQVRKGVLDFADRSLDTPFQARIRDLAGTVSGLGTAEADPARVQLEGRVEPYGLARIRGSIELEAPKTLTNVVASFRNLDVAAFTSYAAKFAGYRIRSGRVSADLRYRVRDGRLVGDNDLRFESLQLGEKVESAGAPDLPLELAVAVLSDAQGRINVAIPVSGDLNNPRVDFAGLVSNAIRNVIGRIVSAPFRALARLFGRSGEQLDQVRFEPGGVALTPPQEEALAHVAQALAERPQLELTVRGAYDPQADIEAMRRRAVRRDIVRAAGYELKGNEDPGGLYFSDPKILHAAENLFLQRVGNRAELAKLRESGDRYPRMLVEQLAAKMPIAPAAGEKLASARAETVRAALVVNGVNASRVRVDAPQSQSADKDGVPTVLALAMPSENARAARNPGMEEQQDNK